MHSGMFIHHIVAMAENHVIGRAGGMPWHIPEDFKFFKSTTMNHAMIMGRKTWDSIGRALPGRATVVVTRSKDFKAPQGVIVKPTVDEAIAWCKDHAQTWGAEVFVVGGGEIYRQTLPFVDKVYLTKVHSEVEGDTTYPEFSTEEFSLISSTPHLDAEVPFTFLTYQRKVSSQ